MIGCDSRPGYPPDRTVRGDRRPRDRFRPAPSRPAQAAVRRRAGMPGRGPGPAGRPVRASLAADVLGPAGSPVSLSAASARLSQAAEGSGAAAGRGAGSPGPAMPVVVRPGAADRRHPGAVRRFPGDRQAVRPGRVGALWVLRGAFALVLGLEAVPDHHPGRDAGGGSCWPSSGGRHAACTRRGGSRGRGRAASGSGADRRWALRLRPWRGRVAR